MTTKNSCIASLILIMWYLPMAVWGQAPDTGNMDHMQMDPPFGGTIFIDPDIITPTDPSTFLGITYAGQGMRTMYDRRVNNWIMVNAYLFDATFDDGLSAEIQVNPEFGNPTNAETEAQKYGWAIGQLPTALRADVQTVWIHKGTEPFGGGNNNLLIHVGQGDQYIMNGILEETFVHEAAHTSLDNPHATAAGWIAAQNTDPDFISDYAEDFPVREDIAESFLPYLAIRYRSDRISATLDSTITNTIPNRIAYFDGLGLNMYPITPATDISTPLGSGFFSLLQNFPNPALKITTILYTTPGPEKVTLRLVDLLGNELQTWNRRTPGAGTHAFQVDVSALPAGMYMYQLRAGDRWVGTRRLEVVR